MTKKTYTIKKQEDLEQFKDDYRYYVDGDLDVYCNLEFSSHLVVKGNLFIKAGYSIEAGYYIKAGGFIFSFIFNISCKKLTTKLLPFDRYYYAEMPPLKKWKKEILDTAKCWDDYKKIITKKNAKEICAWEGWHWIVRAQLEMFFGLKEEYEVKK